MSKFDQMMSHPDRFFDHPQAVERAEQLSNGERMAILRQWRDEVLQLQTAEAENMMPDEKNGSNNRLLGEINASMARLTRARGELSHSSA